MSRSPSRLRPTYGRVKEKKEEEKKNFPHSVRAIAREWMQNAAFPLRNVEYILQNSNMKVY